MQAAADLLLVLLFVVIGRASHHEALTPAGIAATAWPFLVGGLVGWVGARAWRRPTAVRTGIVVWAATVIVGMLLRLVARQGVEPAFVVVATLVLALFLVARRVIEQRLRHR